MTKIGLMYEQEKQEALKEYKKRVEIEIQEIRDEADKKLKIVEKEKALLLIRAITNAVEKFGMSVGDACFDMDVSRSEYEHAKRLVEEQIIA